MSFNSRSFSNGFKGQLDRLKTAKLSKTDITEKIATKISASEITERMKKISTAEITERMKKGVDQVASYAKTVADKIPTEKTADKGVITLNSDGYEVYNLEDSNEVYVARVSEKALFDEDNFIIERAQPDVFIGAPKEEEADAAPAVVEKPEVNSESLFAHVVRGGATEIHATVGTYKDGVIEEYSGSDMDQYDDIVIIPMTDDIVAEIPEFEEVPAAAPVVAAMPSRIEVEPLVSETESNEMLPSADQFISAMTTEMAYTGSGVEPLKVKPMEDDSFSKDALTPVTEKKTTSRAPRFVFKDGKIQMVASEDDSSSFTVNRSACIEDEVSGVMIMTLPELLSYDECPEDEPCEQIPDDGMEAIPFPTKERIGGAFVKEKESVCGKVTFEFENRSSDYGLIGFSF